MLLIKKINYPGILVFACIVSCQQIIRQKKSLRACYQSSFYETKSLYVYIIHDCLNFRKIFSHDSNNQGLKTIVNNSINN